MREKSFGFSEEAGKSGESAQISFLYKESNTFLLLFTKTDFCVSFFAKALDKME